MLIPQELQLSQNLGSADIVIGNNMKIDRFTTQRKLRVSGFSWLVSFLLSV